MSKTLNIIPHTHWDREWYMSFEEHRMRLVKLVDSLIETMEQNPDYKYFHFDGQCIPVEDYLEIRPQMRERLLKLIREDRIQIGPWYILQDEYLTDGEANVRNMIEGLRICKELEVDPVMTGYLPDAFGNISQMPQILAGFGIESAVFGRGLNSLGADNTIMQQNGIFNSEINWQSPDGSAVMGVMYANWYHNAMELPTDPEQLRERLDTIIANTEKFALTDELLGMNGCDHQPVQTDLHVAIAEAKKMGYRIRHTNFKEYLKRVSEKKDSFKTVVGEIAGQLTNGYMLLINTASARIYIKQMNHDAQDLLAREAEPLAAAAEMAGGKYDSDLFRYSWRMLMQNHPHDSICSCNVDEISSEMVTRFNKSMQVSSTLAKNAMEHLTACVDTASVGEHSVTVFNREPYAVSETVSFFVDYEEDEVVKTVAVFKGDERLSAKVEAMGRTFTYTLPDNCFRKPKHVNRFRVTLAAPQIPGFGYETYRIEKAETDCEVFTHGTVSAENKWIAISIKPNGTMDVTNKLTGKTVTGALAFEDCGDSGEEYNFYEAEGCTVTSENAAADISVAEETAYGVTFAVALTLEVPETVVDKKRCGELVPLAITSYVTLRKDSPRIDVKTVINNTAKNHRLRVLFPIGVNTPVAYADSQFDLVARDIQPWEGWENPSNTQRCQAFFELCADGVDAVVAGRGLHEYEIIDKNVMALTLLRAVGEIGDWGYFPAPDAQCLGLQTVEYAFILGDAEKRSCNHALAASFATRPLSARADTAHTGCQPSNKLYFALNGKDIRMSAFKKAEDGNGYILRLFSSSEEAQTVTLDVPAFSQVAVCRMDETNCLPLEIENGKVTFVFPAKKIMTFRLQA